MKMYIMRRTARCVSALAAVLACPIAALAQSGFEDGSTSSRGINSLTYKFETESVASDGNHAPFWFTSNRQGLSSYESKSVLAHFGADGHMLFPRRFGIGYGMDLGLAEGLQSDWYLHQMYVDLDYKCLQLSFGAKERWGELANPELGSGSLTWSGNSRPIPQVRMGIPEFTRIKALGGWFSVKGHIAFGIYTDSKWRARDTTAAYTDGLKYHSKALFVRFGDEKRFPLSATLGLEMYSQFGGTMHNRRFSVSDAVMREYALPEDLAAYWNILMPFNAVGGQTKTNGNSLGSWHLSFDYAGNDWGARAYYEHFYEDHSSMLGIEYKSDMEGRKDFVFYGFRRNWFDALWGLEFNLPDSWPVRDAVFEVLNTRGQCGPVYKYQTSPILEGVDGRDGMYTHEVYDSYSHWGYAEGSPLLISPVYNSDGDQRFKSNRVLAFHAGLDGSIGPKTGWKILVSGSRHWGTYETPFNETEDITSCLLSAFYRLGDTNSWKVGLSLGFDFDSGSSLGDNRGIMLSISRLWEIR